MALRSPIACLYLMKDGVSPNDKHICCKSRDICIITLWKMSSPRLLSEMAVAERFAKHELWYFFKLTLNQNPKIKSRQQSFNSTPYQGVVTTRNSIYIHHINSQTKQNITRSAYVKFDACYLYTWGKMIHVIDRSGNTPNACFSYIYTYISTINSLRPGDAYMRQ